MKDEKPKEKKEYVKPDIQQKGGLGDKLGSSGMDIGL